jgi:pyruvate-ferredoxin/flavodoxin oxidoreductase
MSPRTITVDANEAVASVAHRSSELVAIYPITPASPMGELADEWSSAGRPNLWGLVPRIVQMQSEGGAIGALHGALQAGALATTFTSSQGLLLMIPNLYKIAGELTATCLHVAARSVATHALSIFGDHSDVMACRQTGVAMLASGSVQEAQDLAAIAHAATLSARLPFLHFFDGFRTSHEVAKIEALDDDDLRALFDEGALAAHRSRAQSPDRPVIRGTAQNPDTFFQAREACNPFYDACPGIVQAMMDRFAARTGRRYRLFDYVGHPEADRVLVLMGSGAEVAHEATEWLLSQGERVGVLKVRLFRPFDSFSFASALPETARRVAVLDRTKEPGAPGEPLYLDVVAALAEAREVGRPRVVGGRYGLASKEFTPAMVKAIFDELAKERPNNHFTIGIRDDVTFRSLPFDRELDIEPEEVTRAVFFGLGSDGTVSANKTAVKIIGEGTDSYAQGYFVHDSKKSGTLTVSHLRFSPRPLRSSYRIRQASFVGVSQEELLDHYDVLELAGPGAIFLLNTPRRPDRIWGELPREVEEEIIAKRIRLFVVDASRVAEEVGLPGRIGTVMQACFFALSGVLGREQTTDKIRPALEKAYGKRGPEVVAQNLAAMEHALERLAEVSVPAEAGAARGRPPVVPLDAPDFVQRVTAMMLAGKGDRLPVSAFPADGTFPVGTSRWEKRSIADHLPVLDPGLCIQCNKCALQCPHAAIRAKVIEPRLLEGAPAGFVAVDYKAGELAGQRYALQVAPDDCTGCGVCVEVCPAKDKKDTRRKALSMEPAEPRRALDREAFNFFAKLPEVDRRRVHLDVKGSQLLQPLFEFPGACAGCGEAPYLKLLTQLFGDRLLIANATGCSSIYGGSLPTTPYCENPEGRGPAWSNSLFEDNAEFGFGLRLGLDVQARVAASLLARLASLLGDDLVKALLEADQRDEAGIASQRERVRALRERLAATPGDDAKRLSLIADHFVKKSVWLVGGDGWAYDIGFGGLDHVLASKEKVNVLVLDTEVYSNTGGQTSKATPLGATAKFSAAGKETAKKDLGLIAMTYGHVYVAMVAMGAKDAHAVRAFEEAEAYPGPSLVIAHCPCIAHGYDLCHGPAHQRLAVESGMWPLYRFDPRRIAAGEPPLKLEGGPQKASVLEYMQSEGRFRAVERKDPERFQRLVSEAERIVKARRAVYDQLAGLRVPVDSTRQ